MKVGSWMNVLALLGAVFVLFAPALLGYAPKHGNPWSGIVLGSDVIAGFVIIMAIAGLAGFWSRYLHHVKAPSSDQ